MNRAFIHPQALCESGAIGSGTRVWAFAHILSGARIGCDCNICDGVFIEGDVTVGDRVTLKCGVQLWNGVCIEDDVFIGPNATFTNDLFPRSKVYPAEFAKTIVRKGASIGANATLLSGIEIGVGAMVGAGAVVTRSVPPNAIVVGNPARISGYVGARDNQYQGSLPTVHLSYPGSNSSEIGVGGATLHSLRHVKDMRGDLSVGEFERDVPFIPKRYFVVYDVPSREVRGEHAHRSCLQFLICLKGSCGVLLDDGQNRREITLDRADVGIYMPSMIWGTQYRYSEDAVLLVFASEYYDAGDYIRDYGEFSTLVSKE